MTKRVRIWLYALAALIVLSPFMFILALDYYAIARLKPAPLSDMTLIAHAGGGLKQGMKSNAMEAFDQSAQRGFIYIEADFSETKSGELVLIHNWDMAWHEWFSGLHFMPDRWAKERPEQAETAAKFLSADMRRGLTQMSADDLMAWLESNPNIRLITDFKDAPLQNLRTLTTRYPAMTSRIIPQIYHPDEYEPVKAMGYKDIIFTAYRSKLPDDEIIAFMDQNEILALTVPVETVTDHLITEATLRGIPVWVHRGKNSSPYTIMNTPEFAARWKARGISGLYTDYLYPADE